jgi:hypothetical protein
MAAADCHLTLRASTGVANPIQRSSNTQKSPDSGGSKS